MGQVKHLAVVLLLSACTFHPSNYVTVQVRRPANNRSVTASQMDCYFVNVTGNGVPATSSYASIDSSCVGLGNTSGFVTGATLQSGVQIAVPAGTSRKIQVMGITGASGCNSSTVASVLDGYSKPFLYELGNTTTDLFDNTKVTVIDSYTGSQPKDLLSPCLVNQDTWKATAAVPARFESREYHSAVWTGTEMIIWGGYDGGSNYYSDGARYNPAGDTWKPMSSPSISGRALHSAVWTGAEMIVWGGIGASSAAGLADGARYNPKTDTWSSMSPSPLSGRSGQSFVWTGSEVIVWGGYDGMTFFSNDGARYNPTTDSWNKLPTAPIVHRELHTAVWTGSEMIIWGGVGSTPYADGARYNPASNSWNSVSTSPLSGRYSHSAVWTGSEMIVWGGEDSGNSIYFSDGATYDPVADKWSSISGAGLKGRYNHASIWTGSEMIVWGGSGSSGYYADGARFNPIRGSWAPVATFSGFAARYRHTSVWTGSEMITWGGMDGSTGLAVSSGGRYVP